MESIGAVLPTRGLVFSEALESLLENLENTDHRIYISKNLKIPDGINSLVDKALTDGADYILFTEEDTVLPETGLKDLLSTGADIAAIDYGVSGYSCITRDQNTDEILWCGLGATLVRREVLEAIGKPYFRCDKALLLNYYPEIRWIDPGPQSYGLHDIYFGVKARELGFKIAQARGECKHLLLEELGRKEVNFGLHKIGVKEKIQKHNKI